MQSKQIEELKEQTKILFKVVDKLEQRISSLEKVLGSHSKCIGELREEKNDTNWNGKRNHQSNKNRK